MARAEKKTHTKKKKTFFLLILTANTQSSLHAQFSQEFRPSALFTI